MNEIPDEIINRLVDINRRINPSGSDGTHTKHTDDFTDDEVKSVQDAILDLYALIFIKYFIENEVDLYTSPKVLYNFSLLHPIIRCKTWSYLYNRDKNNIIIADKLCLSVIKVHGKERALRWIERNREEIKNISYPTREQIDRYNRLHTIEVTLGNFEIRVSLDFDSYDNMYELLYSKINDSRTGSNEKGVMYRSFEEAIIYFREAFVELMMNVIKKNWTSFR